MEKLMSPFWEKNWIERLRGGISQGLSAEHKYNKKAEFVGNKICAPLINTYEQNLTGFDNITLFEVTLVPKLGFMNF